MERGARGRPRRRRRRTRGPQPSPARRGGGGRAETRPGNAESLSRPLPPATRPRGPHTPVLLLASWPRTRQGGPRVQTEGFGVPRRPQLHNFGVEPRPQRGRGARAAAANLRQAARGRRSRRPGKDAAGGTESPAPSPSRSLRPAPPPRPAPAPPRLPLRSGGGGEGTGGGAARPGWLLRLPPPSSARGSLPAEGLLSLPQPAPGAGARAPQTPSRGLSGGARPPRAAWRGAEPRAPGWPLSSPAGLDSCARGGASWRGPALRAAAAALSLLHSPSGGGSRAPDAHSPRALSRARPRSRPSDRAARAHRRAGGEETEGASHGRQRRPLAGRRRRAVPGQPAAAAASTGAGGSIRIPAPGAGRAGPASGRRCESRSGPHSLRGGCSRAEPRPE